MVSPVPSGPLWLFFQQQSPAPERPQVWPPPVPDATLPSGLRHHRFMTLRRHVPLCCLTLVSLTGCAEHRSTDPPAATQAASATTPPSHTASASPSPSNSATAACPEGEVYIPPTGPGGFIMGKDYMKSDAPQMVDVGKGHRTHTDVPHRVVLTRPFCMDAHEVTVGQWVACMDAGNCEQPNTIRPFVTWPNQLDHPVNCVDWRAAKKYCELRGKTLPSEAQWEWAATGGDGRTYPWGNEAPTCEHADYVPGVLPSAAGDAGCHGGGPSPVGTHRQGDRKWPSGAIHDLAGNVWEWTLDNYQPYEQKEQVDPVIMTDESLVHSVRGGGWNRSHAGIRSAFRGGARVGYQVPGLGFRCVRNPGS